jgi:hypothetical protein
MADAATLAKRAEHPRLRMQPGREEVSGYGVMAVPFASGDVLCLRRFPGSTFGPGYDSVWHRSPEGKWTVYTTVAPELSCPRFIGAATTRTVQTPIEVQWTGPQTLDVRVPAADLAWKMALRSTPVTRMMNAMMAVMPGPMYRSNLVLSMMSLMSTIFLRAGQIRLRGAMPNRQWYQAGPRKIWMIREAQASIGGRDLGPLGPLVEQARLGDFSLPQQGLFMIGGGFFEAYSPERHQEAPRAQAA